MRIQFSSLSFSICFSIISAACSTATQLHKMTYQFGIGAVDVVVVNLKQTLQFDFYLQISNVHFSLDDDLD